MSFKNMGLGTKILVAMILGSICGVLLGPIAGKIEFIGTLWLDMIKMFIVPVVVCMLVKGVSSMDSPKDLGRIGVKTVVYYIATMILAAILGIILAYLINPGAGFVFESSAKAAKVQQFPGFAGFVSSLISSNMFKSFSDGNLVHVLIISLMIGIAIVKIDTEKRKPVIAWFNSMSELFMKVITIVMSLAPIGVFCLMASVMGKYGLGFIGTISKLLGTFYLGCIIFYLVFYLGIPWLVARFSPVDFIKQTSESFFTAISSCSSAVCVPVNMKTATEKLGIKDSVANFVVSLGATVGQDGGALLSTIVMMFCAQAIGIQFTMEQIISCIVLTAVVTAGSTGLPGGGIMRLMVVAAAMNLPLEIVGIVGAFYRLFDMGTTGMSVVGDLAAAIVINRMEKKHLEKVQTCEI